MALGELANKPDRDCPIGKPEARESCNNQPCLFSDISRIQGGYAVKYTVGQKIKKSPDQKNSWNQINQFQEKYFWPNSVFCNFKNGQKSIFELRKKFETA